MKLFNSVQLQRIHTTEWLNWTDRVSSLLHYNMFISHYENTKLQLAAEQPLTGGCSVQPSSVAQSCPTLWHPMDCSPPAFLSITSSQSLLKLMSIASVMPSNHLILNRPLLLPASIFPSIRVFSNESVLCIIAKYWSFSFSISPSNEYSGIISFRIDWFDLLAVQGSHKSLLQHRSSVQSLSHVQLFVTPWTAARQASLSITNSKSPPKPMSTESVMPSNHLILCHLLLLLPSIFPSIRVFSNESDLCIRWPKY